MSVSLEVFIAGIGVIVACIIGAWQIWPSITSRMEKIIFTVLLGGLSVISLVLMIYEYNQFKDEKNKEGILLNSNEKSMEVEDIRIVVPDQWIEEELGELIVGSQEGGYKLSIVYGNETENILYKPRIRVWVERVGFVNDENIFLENKYQKHAPNQTRVKGHAGIEFDFQGNKKGIDIYKKTLVFLYKENEYKISGTSEILENNVITGAFELIRRKTIFQ